MNKFFLILFFPFTLLGLLLIMIYKIFISPFLSKSCKFTPTCSTYGVIALKRFGFFKGCTLVLKRLFRCSNKNVPAGFDFVPDNIKGDFKWLI